MESNDDIIAKKCTWEALKEFNGMVICKSLQKDHNDTTYSKEFVDLLDENLRKLKSYSMEIEK